MPSDKLKEIAAYKAKIIALEKEVEAEQKKKLANLHKEVGMASTEELIDALKGLKKAPRKAAAKSKGRKRRAKITDAIKAEVANAVKAGKKGAEIAKEFGISIPSIQNIKAELGLVKKRKAKAVKTAAKKAPKKAARKAAKKAAKKTAKK